MGSLEGVKCAENGLGEMSGQFMGGEGGDGFRVTT